MEAVEATLEAGARGSCMGRRRSSPPADRRDWLAPEHPRRARPWAYKEVLLEAGDAGGEEALSALASVLEQDLAELERLHHEVLRQIELVAGLRGQVQALLRSEAASTASSACEPIGVDDLPSFPSEPVRDARDGARLSRCEGFRVDGPEGTIGFVEGLRFASRIDRPDLLEVRGGRFGRRLLLVPVEAVEEVLLDEERLLLRGAPQAHDDLVHELVGRLRRALHPLSL